MTPQIYPTGIPACANPLPVIRSYSFDPESRRSGTLPAQYSERSRSYDFDAVQQNWGEVTIINGQPRRREALTTAFQIGPVVTEVRSVTEELKYVIIPISMDTGNFSAIVPAIDVEKDHWLQHIPGIKRLGCSKTKANDLIAFLIRNARRQVLHLYQTQGFIEKPDGGIDFGCVPEGCDIPPKLLSESIRRRKLFEPPDDPSSLFASWCGLLQRHPGLMFLGLLRVSSLMQFFQHEAGICDKHIFYLRLGCKVSTETMIAVVQTDSPQCPVPLLNAPLRDLKRIVGQTTDGTIVIEDHSFADEASSIDQQQRFLFQSRLSSAGQNGTGRNTVIIVSEFAAYAAQKIAPEQVISLSLDDVELEEEPQRIQTLMGTMDRVCIDWMMKNPAKTRHNCRRRRENVEKELGSITDPKNALFCTLIAGEGLLRDIFGADLADKEQVNQLLDDLISESQSIQNCDSAICSEFASVLSNRFRDGNFKAIRKRNRLRIDPASFTAIVSGERLLVSAQMLDDCLAEMKTAHSTKGIIRALRQQGLLVTEDGNANPTEIHDLSGKWCRLQLYDLPLNMLDEDVLQKMRNLDSEPFWLTRSELPEQGCLPLLQDGNGRFAVRQINRQEQENMHTLVTGQSGTGKSYLLCQLMAFCQELWHHVVVFDFSDSFPQEAMQRNLPPKYVDRRVVFINLDDQSPADSICTASAFFCSPTASSWAQLFEAEDRIIVFRLDIDSHANLFDTLLRTLFRYQKKHPEIPLDVFADEIQNLDFSDGTAVCQLLKEGRKYNIAFHGATQDFFARSTVLGRAMGKAKTMFFLRPTQNSELQVAGELRLRKAEVEAFDAMERGSVIVKAPFYNKIAGYNQPVTLRGKVYPFSP